MDLLAHAIAIGYWSPSFVPVKFSYSLHVPLDHLNTRGILSMNRPCWLAAIALASVSFSLSGSVFAQPQTAKIDPDIVYGHKDGLALTMDAYQPTENRNGATILFMVSGGWYSQWAPPEQTQWLFQPYLAKGYTVFAVRHGSSPRYTIPEAIGDVRLAVRYVHQHAKRT